MFEADQVSGKQGPVSAKGQPETGAEPLSPTSEQLPKQTKDDKQQQPHRPTCQGTTTYKAPLVGKKSQLKCLINSYPETVLFDPGSQVSVVDQEWADTYIPNYSVRPLHELLEEDLGVYAVTGHSIPFNGWVELTVSLARNDDPNLTIQAPLLVGQCPLPQPLVGTNVMGEIIKRKEFSGEAVTMVISLLRSALDIKEEQVEAMVSFIQVPPRTYCGPATVRVGKDNAVIPPGRTVHVWCRVPPNFDASDPLVLYEPAEETAALGELSVGEGLLEINNTRRPYVKVPISNHSKHEITLPKRSSLDTIRHVIKVLETDAPESPQVVSMPAKTARVEVSNIASPTSPPTEPWLPPVDIISEP